MNQNEIDAYRKIAAPSTLKERIVNETKRQRKKFHINAGICYGVAALCAAVILVFTFYPTSKTVLYYNSDALKTDAVAVAEMAMSPYVRASHQEVLIPLTLSTDTKTEVSVSKGFIVIDGKDMGQKAEIKKDTDFFWSVSILGNNEEYSISIDSKKEKSTYCISKNETDGFFIKKVN